MGPPDARDRLAEAPGRRTWRSLRELAGSPQLEERLRREFPALASELDDVGRRDFLRLMGASIALAGLSGCTRQPKETIAPYAKAPEEILPGRPLYFATSLTLAGYATGVLVETHEGRPTKLEGNPDHPASLGGIDVFTQAAILGLYDPDRSRTAMHLGSISPYGEFLGTVGEALKEQARTGGAGIRILTETVTSPTLAHQLGRLTAAFPTAQWHQYEAVGRDSSRAGSLMAFGRIVEPIYRLGEADVIFSLEADFIAPGPGSLRYIREFIRRRQPGENGHAGMNRLYVVESTPSLTGAMADHRLPMAASDIEALARRLASELGLPVAQGSSSAQVAERAGWVAAAARDLRRTGSRAVVMAGETQPPAVHAIAHAVNQTLGSAGECVVYIDPVAVAPPGAGALGGEQMSPAASLTDLARDLAEGRVQILLILGGNPAFTAPADLRFADLIPKAALSAHLSLYQDETSALCHWHIPQAHELESWSDARGFDGTASIIQPMIEPLYAGVTAHQVLALFSGAGGRSSYEIVREHWRQRTPPGADFERWWRRALHDGLIAGTAFETKRMSLAPGWSSALSAPGGAAEAAEPSARAEDGLEIVFRQDASVFDGRFANNGWLQELPRPITKLTWDNAALISPRLAERLGLASEDAVELTLQGRAVDAAVWIVPGQAAETVTVHMGYGRSRSGRVGEGTGFSAYALRGSSSPWFAQGLRLRATGRRYPLACTQEHQSMEGRHHARAATLEEFREHPEFARHLGHEPGRRLTLYPEHKYEGYAWGMAIDLNRCVGCNACVIACQSENNIPVVGKRQVAIGREMHWIRVDRYFEGSPEQPAIWHQPVPCMHCENAPCEPVCPVGATVHSSEGLNDMVYNRCVGTRYCSNNCPYKVRRFNFFLYSDYKTPSLKLLNNPDVTVRSRGVMEKCTYCVQRINAARIESAKKGNEIRDGEIVTACQQACPAEAIVFGDVNDPASRVSKVKASPRDYGLLADLNTRPRTTYQAALRNPNPEMDGA